MPYPCAPLGQVDDAVDIGGANPDLVSVVLYDANPREFPGGRRVGRAGEEVALDGAVTAETHGHLIGALDLDAVGGSPAANRCDAPTIPFIPRMPKLTSVMCSEPP